MAEQLIGTDTQPHDGDDKRIAELAARMRAEHAGAREHTQTYSEAVFTVGITGVDGYPIGTMRRAVPMVTGRAIYAPTGTVHESTGEDQDDDNTTQ